MITLVLKAFRVSTVAIWLLLSFLSSVCELLTFDFHRQFLLKTKERPPRMLSSRPLPSDANLVGHPSRCSAPSENFKNPPRWSTKSGMLLHTSKGDMFFTVKADSWCRKVRISFKVKVAPKLPCILLCYLAYPFCTLPYHSYDSFKRVLLPSAKIGHRKAHARKLTSTLVSWVKGPGAFDA